MYLVSNKALVIKLGGCESGIKKAPWLGAKGLWCGSVEPLVLCRIT